MNIRISGLDNFEFNENWWEDSQPKVAKMLESEQKESWGKEQNPWDGSKWKELSPKYKEEKLKKFGSQPILRATGRMQDQMRIRPTNDGLFNVETTKYGPYHQFGAERLPERTWVGIPDTALPKIADIVAKNISKKRKNV